MILLTDESKYQPTRTDFAGYGGEIINVEDPGALAKAQACRVAGVPWGVYSWLYSGRGVACAQRMLAIVGAWPTGDPPAGWWCDYEDAGITEADLADWFAVCDGASIGARAGYYSNPWRLNHAQFLTRPFWVAAYPGANDGTFPGLRALGQTPRPAQLWQFTSTNGGLDVSVVLDETWWSSWTSGATPAVVTEEEDMHYAVLKALDGAWLGVLANGGFIDQDFGVGTPGVEYGFPHSMLEHRALDLNDKIEFRQYQPAGWQALHDRTAKLAALGTTTTPAAAPPTGPTIDVAAVKSHLSALEQLVGA